MEERELARTVITVFLNDVPHQIQALARSLAAGDTEGARCQAHALKGAAAILSAERFRDTVAKIERAALVRRCSSSGLFRRETRKSAGRIDGRFAGIGLGKELDEEILKHENISRGRRFQQPVAIAHVLVQIR